MHSSATAIILALCASLCFALGLVITQRGLKHVAPNRGAFFSVPTSTTLLWAASPWLVDWHQFVPRSATIFAGIGLFFPAAVTILTFESNRRMGPNITGALGNLAPLFAVLLAAVLFAEIPHATHAFGIAAIIAGVFVLSLARGQRSISWPWHSALLPLAAAAIRGFTQPLAKLGLIDWPNPFAATLIGYSVSSLAIICGNLAFAGADRSNLLRQIPIEILWFILVGICNVTAVLFLYAALTRGSVTLVSPLVATYPLLTLPLSLILLTGQRLSAGLIAGVVLTVIGVVLLIAV